MGTRFQEVQDSANAENAIRDEAHEIVEKAMDEGMSDRQEPFEFVLTHDEDLTLELAVNQAIGAASVCWEDMSGTGVFQDDQARRISAALLDAIRTLTHTEPSDHKLYIRRGNNGQWYWQRRARNGRSVSVGGEGFHNQTDCLDSARAVNRDVSPLNIYINVNPPKDDLAALYGPIQPGSVTTLHADDQPVRTLPAEGGKGWLDGDGRARALMPFDKDAFERDTGY